MWIRGTVEKDKKPGSNKSVNQVKINEILSIDKVVKEKTTDVEVFITRVNMKKLQELKKIVVDSKGDKTLILSLPSEKGRIFAKAGSKYKVSDSELTLNKIRSLFGLDTVGLSNRSYRTDVKTYKQ